MCDHIIFIYAKLLNKNIQNIENIYQLDANWL